jgi:hypothetical protein
MAQLVAFYVFLQLVLLLLFVPILWGISRLARNRSPRERTVLIVSCATLLLTPGWGPATITMVPVPFGLLLGITIFSGHLNDAADVVLVAPRWYAIAFPVTALVVYLFRKSLSSSGTPQSVPK